MERIGLAPGAEIGGYTILAPLGAGGMGTVYRAVDGGGTPVALKLLHPHVGADPSSRERLRREVHALQRLRHPGVAAVLDAEADSTEAFLVTELVGGHDLTEHVRLRGRLDGPALHRLADGLRDALAAVHTAGVVHRDLKPSNVIVTPDGPVLIDFGIAQSVDETRVTSTGFVVGTPGYLAPELVDGAEPTPATDWWGWAALLAFAATGRAPFGTRPLEAVLVRTRTGDADLAGLGPVTAGALWDALAPDPADRAEPEQVVAALAEAVARGERYDATAATAVPPGSARAAAAPTGSGAAATLALGGATVAMAGAAQGATPGGTTVAFAGPAAGEAHPGTEVLDAPGGTRVMPTPPVDGRATQVMLPPSVAPGAAGGRGYPVAGDGAAGAGYGDPAPAWGPDTGGRPGDGDWRADPPWPDPVGGHPPGVPAEGPGAWPADGADGPPAPAGPLAPRRPGTVAALAVLVTAAAALRPGITLLVLVPLLLLARTVGSTAEALARRRARTGARRSDALRAVVASPWHLLRGTVTAVPSLLVAGSLVVLVLGAGWWLVGSGRLEAGPLRADGDAPTPAAASLLVAVAAVVGLLALWWGPVARETRTGTRWLVGGLAPGRLGVVLVLLLLAGAAALVTVLATGSVLVWEPFGAPALPGAG